MAYGGAEEELRLAIIHDYIGMQVSHLIEELDGKVIGVAFPSGVGRIHDDHQFAALTISYLFDIELPAAVFPFGLTIAVGQVVETDGIVKALYPTNIDIRLLQRGEVAVILVLLSKLVLKIAHAGAGVTHDEIVEIVMRGQQSVLQLDEARRRVFATGVAPVFFGIQLGAMLQNLQVFLLLWWSLILPPEGLVALSILYGVDDVVVPHNPYLATAALELVLAEIGALAHGRHNIAGRGGLRTEQGRLREITHGLVSILGAVEDIGEEKVDELRLIPLRALELYGVLPLVVHHVEVLLGNLDGSAVAIAQRVVKLVNVLTDKRRNLTVYAVADTVDGILRRLTGGLCLPVNVVVEHHRVFRTVDEFKHVLPGF